MKTLRQFQETNKAYRAQDELSLKTTGMSLQQRGEMHDAITKKIEQQRKEFKDMMAGQKAKMDAIKNKHQTQSHMKEAHTMVCKDCGDEFGKPTSKTCQHDSRNPNGPNWIKQVDEAGKLSSGAKDPCWKGYQMVGMKKKNGKEVPNCVPVKEEAEELDEALRHQIAGAVARFIGNKIDPVHGEIMDAHGREAYRQAATHIRRVASDVTDAISALHDRLHHHLRTGKPIKLGEEVEQIDEISLKDRLAGKTAPVIKSKYNRTKANRPMTGKELERHNRSKQLDFEKMPKPDHAKDYTLKHRSSYRVKGELGDATDHNYDILHKGKKVGEHHFAGYFGHGTTRIHGHEEYKTGYIGSTERLHQYMKTKQGHTNVFGKKEGEAKHADYVAKHGIKKYPELSEAIEIHESHEAEASHHEEQARKYHNRATALFSSSDGNRDHPDYEHYESHMNAVEKHKHAASAHKLASETGKPEHIAAAQKASKEANSTKPSTPDDGENAWMREETSPMIKAPKNEFAMKSDAFAHAKKHGGKVMKKTFTHPTTGQQHVSYVVKEEVELEEEQMYYSLVHKPTKQVLSTHKSLESAKDEHRGMDHGVRAHYYIATSKKEPKTFNMKEATYQGKDVPLNKPMKGDVKKSKVYVDPDGDGKAQKVNFGDKTMSIKKDQPGRKKSFLARHNCDDKNDKTKAGYWSCKAWK